MQLSEPPKANMEASRWRRPRLYLTVVAIILLVSLITAIIIFADYTYRYYKVLENTRQNASLSALIPFLIWIWIGVTTSTVSIIGAAWLLMGKKKGIYLSLAALVLMTVLLPFLVSLYYASLVYYEGWIFEYAFSFYLSIAVMAAMFPLLILGWKRVQWN